MTDRPTEPRLPLITEPDDELAELLSTALSHDGTPLNIFAMLGHHPKLLKRFNLMGGFLLNKGVLPAREREIIILRVGSNATAEYEFAQHTVIGKAVGLSDAEVAGLAGAEHEWSDSDALLLAMADELCADDCVSDETFAALAKQWDDTAMIEMVIVAGFYRLVSGFLNTFGVPLEDGMPGWPA